jgi:hypothetical protein
MRSRPAARAAGRVHPLMKPREEPKRGGARHPRVLKPDSPNRPEIRTMIEAGYYTQKGKPRKYVTPFLFPQK